MDTLLILGIEKLEIDWTRRESNNYAKLFSGISDLKKEKYYYQKDDEGVFFKKREAFSATLSRVLLRMDLLGYSMKKVEELYNNHLNSWKNYYGNSILLDFDGFCKIIKNIDLNNVKIRDYINYSDGFDCGEYFKECIADILGINCETHDYDFYENIDPLIVLRLLGENKENLGRKIIWRFLESELDILEVEKFNKNSVSHLDVKDKYLLITEGKTDTYVLETAIDKLYPEIKDFFYFIDMEENYPFTGTGNLTNFTMGLTKINPLNKILIIFDNDTEGVFKFTKCDSLHLPNNMQIMKLPDLKSDFITRGPLGDKTMQVDGMAIAIECFLDLNYKQTMDPIIRWKSYMRQLNRYQGALEDKEKYIKLYKNGLRDVNYDFSKLKQLIDCIMSECSDLGGRIKN